MKQYTVTITSVTPYMQHRMNDNALKESEKRAGKLAGRPDVNEEDVTRANAVVYRDKDSGKCYIPNSHIKGALIAAGSFVKSKVGARSKSLKQTVAGMFFVGPEKIFLPDFDEVDIRSAVNQKIKARIIVVRPRWNTWEVTFSLKVDEDSISMETVKDIIGYAGGYIGIGSFRPTSNGEFGRFELKNIKEVDAKK